METKSEYNAASLLFAEVVRLVPEYMRDPVDAGISDGNVALCIIDAAGRTLGQIWGSDKARGRFSFGIVGRKAIQVWQTGYPTGRFEELAFTGKVDESKFGISKPDFIGWLGGVPFVTADGSLLAAAFSGFRGESDVAILLRAATKVPGLRPKTE